MGALRLVRDSAIGGFVGAEHVQVRSGAYADSVTLMQVSANAQAIGGVRAAMIAMATELNLALLTELGMAPPSGVGPHDLVVAIKADDTAALDAALEVVDAALAGRAPTVDQAATVALPPRTTSSAIARSGTGIVLVSVPGQYAFAEAMDALGRGCDVMIFSDNMPVEQEVRLKDVAAERGLLVMGPDCGTAIVAGVGLGFANAVRPGPVGVLAASGTGAQQFTCLLDAAGVGCSAVLGLGGRDLSATVGGRSARTALAALDADPATELIVLLSKPPAPEVAAGLREYASTLTKPVQFALIDPDQPNLTSAVESTLRILDRPIPHWSRWPSPNTDTSGTSEISEASGIGGAGESSARGTSAASEAGGTGGAGESPASGTSAASDASGIDGTGESLVSGVGRVSISSGGGLRGLFAGGTLRDEATVIVAERLGDSSRYLMIDFGADELTVGRPHPMIDQRLRLDRFTAEAVDPATAVIMLDVVLGFGAHPDPAAEIAPRIVAAKATRPIEVVISLIGTDNDPQGLAAQADALSRVGAHVFASNAQAARFACDLLTSGQKPLTGATGSDES